VFAGEEDRIPIILTPPCPNAPSREELVRDTGRAVAATAAAFALKAAVGADWIPCVNIAWYQGIVVPSFFGAEPLYPAGSEPIVKPHFATVRDAVDAGIPRTGGPVLDEMLAVLHKAQQAVPDGFCLSFPPTASPFDLAQLLLGEEYLVALIAEPEETLKFLDNLTELCIQVTDVVKAELGMGAREWITNRGIFVPGLRLPCDAIVNLSPELIRRSVLPVLERFGRKYGRLCIHFCTEPAPSQHVLPVLSESPYVAAVDNWQGPEPFIGETSPAPLQARVAVITDVDVSASEKMTAFLSHSAVRDVPRKGGRGLVVSSPCASVEEGRRIYAAWRRLMG
jgi:hypothetical protein